jgi:D-glycero-D-manno-heptose 1,7-bisphosphate phosphatase
MLKTKKNILKTEKNNTIPHYTLDSSGKILYQNNSYDNSMIKIKKWRGLKKSIDGRLALIDRDGVIIEKALQHQYHYSNNNIKLIDGATEAIKYLNDKNIPVIIVTNQRGIYKKIFSETDLIKMNTKIQEIMQTKIPSVIIDGVIYCPHSHSIKIDNIIKGCKCRKPEPGMLLAIMKMYNVSHKKTFMFGDFESDLKAAMNAQVNSVYIATKHDQHKDNDNKIKKRYPKIYGSARYETLYEAVKNTFK